jgi:hypothetical protein
VASQVSFPVQQRGHGFAGEEMGLPCVGQSASRSFGVVVSKALKPLAVVAGG